MITRISCCLLLVSFFLTRAQEQTEPIRFGVYAFIKAEVNSAAIPDGWKTGVELSSMPDVGVSGMIPLNTILSAGFEAGLEKTAVMMRPYNMDSDSSVSILSTTYLGFTPLIEFSNFFAGITIGVPLSSTRMNHAGSIVQNSYSDSGNAREFITDIGLLWELRIGASIPIVRDESGTLNLTPALSYQLTGTFRSFSSPASVLYRKTSVKEHNNPRIVSVGIGLQYMFDWTPGQD